MNYNKDSQNQVQSTKFLLFGSGPVRELFVQSFLSLLRRIQTVPAELMISSLQLASCTQLGTVCPAHRTIELSCVPNTFNAYHTPLHGTLGGS